MQELRNFVILPSWLQRSGLSILARHFGWLETEGAMLPCYQWFALTEG